MTIKAIAPQLRTTDMAATIAFYTEMLGFSIAFNYQDFYVGITVGNQMLHLKHIDETDPSIRFVDLGGHLHLYFDVEDVISFADQLKAKGVHLVKEVHETDWNTREIVLYDDQGHTLYFGEQL